MNKYFILILIAAGLCCACNNELEVEEHRTVDSGEMTLGYTIPSYKADVYSVEPDTTETAIQSVFYVFIAKTGETSTDTDLVVATSYRSGLKIEGRQGKIPLVIPEGGLPKDSKNYEVKIIANWEHYLRNGIRSVEAMRISMLGSKRSEIDKLESDGGLGNPTTMPVHNVPLLYAGSFDYVVGAANINVTLRRKMIVFDVSLTLPTNISLTGVGLSNIAAKTNLFNDDKIKTYETSSSSNFVPKDITRFKVYALPNLGGGVMNLKLKTKVKTPTFNSSSETANGIFGSVDEEVTFDIPLSVDKLGGTFFANQYVALNIKESLLPEKVLSYDINGWSSEPFSGVYMRNDAGNGVGISPTNLTFDFADVYPKSVVQNAILPSGSFAKEIFVSTHGLSSGWDLDKKERPEWLTITKSPVSSTVLVRVEPNFSVDELGRIHSAARSYTFNIIFAEGIGGASNENIPITISQKAAPVIPGEVILENGERKITLADRYVGATSPNYFSNGGREATTAVGDRKAKGKYQTMKNPAVSVFSACGGDYHMLTIEEMYTFISPMLRVREMSIRPDQPPYLVYYLSNGSEITFFNLSGNSNFESTSGFDQNPVTSIYLDHRQTAIEEPKGNDPPERYAVFFGMRLSSQFQNILSLKSDVTNIEYILRCVRNKTL